MSNDRYSSAWPPITYERRHWEPSVAVPGSRRNRLAALGPYDAAVVPEIAQVETVPLSPPMHQLVTEASVEIARFDTEMGSEIAPFAAVLLRSESVASSRIENLTASAKSIAMAELGDRSRQNAALIVDNTTAMQSAIALADHLDEDAILSMHKALLESSHPEWVGRWRNEQVWIGGSNVSPHRARFVPPHHDRVPPAMADLVRFMAREDIEPLVQATIAHAQFATIHPFPDGNGRVGRALIHALLRGKELTRNITIPVSAGLLTDVDRYFHALERYRQGDAEEIVGLMADAAFSSIGNGRQLVSDLRGARQGWSSQILARSGAVAWRVADLLLRQPVIDSPTVQSTLGISAMSANRAIATLVEAGVLTKVSGNYRNQKWAAIEVLACLDDFSERAGRRGHPGRLRLDAPVVGEAEHPEPPSSSEQALQQPPITHQGPSLSRRIGR